MTLRAYFKDYYNLLTSSEQEIINVLDTNLSVLDNYSISNIAQFTNSSTSSISRLIYKLNLENYQAFKYILQDLSRRNSVSVASNLLEQEFFNFFTQVNYNEIDEIIRDLYSHEIIYICAVGQSNILARYFSEILFTYNINNIVIGESHLLNQLQFRLTKSSYVIFISSSGSTTTLLDIAQVINKHRYDSLLITSNVNALLSKYTSKTIIASSPFLNILKQSVNFQSPIYSLIDLILIKYAEKYLSE